jgi:hypothetical protein
MQSNVRLVASDLHSIKKEFQDLQRHARQVTADLMPGTACIRILPQT